jgi:hypothetical protein
MERYNTNFHLKEFYDGGAWRQVSIAQPIAGGYRGLKIINNSGSPNIQVDVTADALTVETTSGVAYRLRSVSVTPDVTVSGAGGLDTGSVATSTWYSVWIIYNPTTDTTAGLFSLSATAPTMPSGYTAKARFGWVRTDSASNFLRTIQYGQRTYYRVTGEANNAALPQIIGTNGGNPSAATYVTASVSSLVPTTAATIGILWPNVSNTSGNFLIAPSANYGAAQSTSNPPPISFSSGGSAPVTYAMNAWIQIESTNIYYSGNVNSSANVFVVGWEDNL